MHAKNCINLTFCFNFSFIKYNLIIQLLEMYKFRKYDEVVENEDTPLEDYTGFQKTMKNDINTDLIHKRMDSAFAVEM